MNCTDIREELVEVASGSPVTPVVEGHVRDCPGCAQTLEHLKQTMAMMDEWAAPEPSPYFDTRLQARLREERATKSVSWLEWLRRPVAVMVATVLVVAGGLLYQSGGGHLYGPANTGGQQAPVVAKGTPVWDLQFLDKNSEVLDDFDALDALDGTPDDNGSVAN
jgi:predicted anti-sigma-YlaC factor YlaD